MTIFLFTTFIISLSVRHTSRGIKVSFTDALSHMDQLQISTFGCLKTCQVMVVYPGHPWSWLVLMECHCEFQVLGLEAPFTDLSLCQDGIFLGSMCNPMAIQLSGPTSDTRNMLQGRDVLLHTHIKVLGLLN